MVNVIKLIQGDTGPQLKIALTDEVTGAPIDLTGSTVLMYFRESGAITVLETLTASLVSPAAGVCSIAWNPTTLDVPEGTYEGEIEVVFADTTKQSVFQPLIFAIRGKFS